MMCLECRQKPAVNKGRYCSATCRLAFNNRRQLRGAVLYDAVMVQREQAGAFKDGAHDFPPRLEQLLVDWETEDAAAGRLITTPPLFEIGYKLPHVRARAKP